MNTIGELRIEALDTFRDEVVNWLKGESEYSNLGEIVEEIVNDSVPAMTAGKIGALKTVLQDASDEDAFRVINMDLDAPFRIADVADAIVIDDIRGVLNESLRELCSGPGGKMALMEIRDEITEGVEIHGSEFELDVDEGPFSGWGRTLIDEALEQIATEDTVTPNPSV